MKKLFIVYLSIILIFSLFACSTDSKGGSNIPSDDLSEQEEYFEEYFDFDEDTYDEFEDEDEGYEETDSKQDSNSGERGFKAFYDARMEFLDHVWELSSEEETVMAKHTMVLAMDTWAYDYMKPLVYWGETLDESELAVVDRLIGLITINTAKLKSYDIEVKSDNHYTLTGETEKDEEVQIDVEYFSDIDAVHLEATNNGERALLFEYIKTPEGYAAQFYFNAVVASSYNVQEKAMCVYRIMFSENGGSCARFDDVEEPASILGGVPGEQEFIKGATHWFTLEDGKFTGELDGSAF
ncbi:MAG: hypothetical protein ACOX1Q_03900 [Eubacteriales bacterium]|jgi:hypothetical protein